jgi:hypothetical protein
VRVFLPQPLLGNIEIRWVDLNLDEMATSNFADLLATSLM